LSRYIISDIVDDNYFKPDRKDDVRGELIASYTPDEFILDLAIVKVYSANSTATLSPYTTTPEGVVIPRHVNIVHSRGFIRDVPIASSSWDGIHVEFLPGIGSTQGLGSPMMGVISVVGIDLGADYDAVTLPNEATAELIDYSLTSGLHYFTMAEIQPFDVPFLSYLIIGNDITTEGIQNPSGEMPPADPGYWELPGANNYTSGNASMIFIPGEAVDFSSFANPEIVFNWDLTDLIEVYEGVGPGPDDDVVTFNLARPFPVDITIQEKSYDVAAPVAGDVIPTGEVQLGAIYGNSSYNVLIWINPPDEDFEKIVIVRKEGSEPVDGADGDVVYEGYEPNFCDITGTAGVHYYYKIFTVDYSGNYSSGVVLDKTIQ